MLALLALVLLAMTTAGCGLTGTDSPTDRIDQAARVSTEAGARGVAAQLAALAAQGQSLSGAEATAALGRAAGNGNVVGKYAQTGGGFTVCVVNAEAKVWAVYDSTSGDVTHGEGDCP